jgi:hypothetical protein
MRRILAFSSHFSVSLTMTAKVEHYFFVLAGVDELADDADVAVAGAVQQQLFHLHGTRNPERRRGQRRFDRAATSESDSRSGEPAENQNIFAAVT